jgi:hypothetical protein
MTAYINIGIKPPILIVDTSGEVDCYPDIEGKEGYLIPIGVMEPDQIRRGEYVAYDGEGRLLMLSTKIRKLKKQFLFFRYTDPVEYVVVQPAETEPSHTSELRDKIIYHLTQRGAPQTETSHLSLQELVARVC